MAKDKKTRKAKKDDKKDDNRLELIAGPANGDGGKKKKGGKNRKEGKDRKEHGGLEGLMKLADHPLLGDLLAVGALAAVAAIAESGKDEPARVKSRDAVKTAGKAAAAAIGARLLKEVTSGGAKADAKAAKPDA